MIYVVAKRKFGSLQEAKAAAQAIFAETGVVVAIEKAKPTKAEKLADKRIEEAYYRTCSGVQIPIMKIPAIFRSVRAAMKPDTTDEQLDVLVKVTVDMIRVN